MLESLLKPIYEDATCEPAESSVQPCSPFTREDVQIRHPKDSPPGEEAQETAASSKSIVC